MWGPHRLTENSRVTSVTCLRLHKTATVDPIDFWRENCHRAISEFCNNIGTKRRNAASHNSVAIRGAADMPRSRPARQSDAFDVWTAPTPGDESP